MKSYRSIVLICTLLFLVPMIAQANPGLASSSAPATNTDTVAETINSGGYTYIRLKEQGTWIATSTMAVSVGDKVEYRGGMEMRNFHSKTLARDFESILFAQHVSRVGQSVDNMHREAMVAGDHGADKIAIPKPVTVALPAPGEIAPLTAGKTITDIVAESASLKDQTVSLRARVIKVSENIKGKNWITLQDGTGTKPDNKLLATSVELVVPGDLVIAKGILRNNIDIGSGYTYKVLLEETTFLKSEK